MIRNLLCVVLLSLLSTCAGAPVFAAEPGIVTDSPQAAMRIAWACADCAFLDQAIAVGERDGFDALLAAMVEGMRAVDHGCYLVDEQAPPALFYGCAETFRIEDAPDQDYCLAALRAPGMIEGLLYTIAPLSILDAINPGT